LLVAKAQRVRLHVDLVAPCRSTRGAQRSELLIGVDELHTWVLWKACVLIRGAAHWCR